LEHQISSSLIEKETLQNSYERIKAEKEDALQQIEQLRHWNESMTESTDLDKSELESRLSDLKHQLTNCQTEHEVLMQKLSDDIAEKDREITSLRSQQDSTQLELSSLAQKIEKESQLLSEITAMRDELLEQVTKQRSEIDNLVKSNETLEELNMLLTEQNESQSNQLSSIQEQANQLELDLFNQIVTHDTTRHTLEQQLIVNQEEIQNQKQRIEVLENMNNDSMSMVEKLNDELEEYNRTIQTLTLKNDELQAKIDQHSHVSSSDIQSLKQAIQTLEKEKEDFAQKNEDLTYQLSQVQHQLEDKTFETVQMGHQLALAQSQHARVKKRLETEQQLSSGAKSNYTDFKKDLNRLLDKLLKEHANVNNILNDLHTQILTSASLRLTNNSNSTLSSEHRTGAPPRTPRGITVKTLEETEKQRIERLEQEKKFIVSLVEMYRRQGSIGAERVETLAQIISQLVTSFELSGENDGDL